MNQDNQKSSDKEVALQRVIAAMRASQTASDMMDDTFARLLGVNRTDGRCLDIVQRLGRITAGELSQESGLTTGAVTVVIDRLEKAGYLQRVRDQSDRRKVFVELTDLARQMGEIIYSTAGQIGEEGMSSVSAEGLNKIARFLHVNAVMNRKIASLLAEYVAPDLGSAAERLLAAKNYAARVARESDALREDMLRAIHEDELDERSGKLAK